MRSDASWKAKVGRAREGYLSVLPSLLLWLLSPYVTLATNQHPSSGAPRLTDALKVLYTDDEGTIAQQLHMLPTVSLKEVEYSYSFIA